jgi:twitching motility protein PilT
MSSMQIDRLLDTVVKTRRVRLHLTVGRRPTIRHHGGLKDLQTKVLDSDDMVSLMKAITPERNQQELQEEGGTDFGFAYGDAARFRVSVFRQRGDLAIVLRQIPNRLLTFEQIGLPEVVRDLIRRPRGMFLVTGPDRLGQDDVAGDDDRLRQHDDGPAHRDDGRPDRVLPLAQEVDRQPA